MKSTHVELVYFRETGKYYSEGELDLPYKPNGQDDVRPWMFHEVLEHVADLLNRGERPGLVDGMHFDVLVVVYTEFGPLRFMFVRDKDGYVGMRSLRVTEAY